MKIRNLFAAALLPLTLACAKENLNKTEDNASISLSVNVSSEDTKASFSDTDGLIWVQDNVGQAGLVKATGGDHSVPSTSSAITDQYKITFNFSGINAGSYRLFYPYAANTHYDQIQFSVPQEQESSAGKSSDIFAGISEDLIEVEVEAGTTTTDPTCKNVKYNAVGSYIRFRVYGKEGLAVSAINIESQDSKVAGLYYIKGEDATLHHTDDTEGAYSTSFVTTNGYTTAASKETSQSIYAAVLPGDSQNTYTVVTDKGFYKFASASPKKFANGSIKEIPLNIGGQTPPTWVPDHLYLVGGSADAWNCHNPVEMKRIEGTNKFEAEVYLIPTTDAATNGYKFLTRKGFWAGAFVNDGSYKMKYYEDPTKGDVDKKFTVNDEGGYKVIVNFDDMSVQNVPLPKVKYKNGFTETANMRPTGELGVYTATIKVDHGNGHHDFRIMQTIGKQITYFCKFNGNNYWNGFDFGSADNASTLSVTCGNIQEVSDANNGWYIVDDYDDNKFVITLDTNNKTVTATLAYGSNFYLCGNFADDSNDWKTTDQYKKTLDGDSVTWKITTNGTNRGFYIYGETITIDNNVPSRGERYFSNGENVYLINSNQLSQELPVSFNYYAKHWELVDQGTYTIQFWPQKLKINVSKNN